MILGNILILSIITLEILDIDKIKKLKETVQEKTELIKENTNNIKEKTKNKKPIKQTTKDGKIKFIKRTIKVDKPKKQFIKLNKQTKKLSLSQYDENKVITHTTYEIPVIDIKKWTQSDICCSNCGATVHTTSEYCFLCDCKIKLNQEKEKLS